MRISGGVHCGRRLKVPPNGVRPTQDRVREAMFCSLAARIPGCSFLDLFAGSGAVGLEAWSRGADRVTWVEKDAKACSVIRENLAALGGKEGRESGLGLARSDVFAWLGGVSGLGFDVIFADPPYAVGDEGLWPGLLGALARPGLLAEGGVLVVEEAAGSEPVTHAGWTTVRDRKYGATRLIFMEPVSARKEGLE